MLRGVGLVVVVMFAFSMMVGLYLIVRHFHHKWKWQNKVNENNIRRSLLEEIDIQWEVDPNGFIQPVRRKDRGHAARVG